MNKAQLQSVLAKYMPGGAEIYASELLVKYSIQLHITKPRSSKYGDYRPPGPGEDHRISLNKDLNPYAFLVTFMHEVAHLLNFEAYRSRVSPHGQEWKGFFQKVSMPIFEEKLLPGDVQFALAKYLNNPAASSCSNPLLFRTLRKYDHIKQLLVEEIPMNTVFKLQDGKQFIKLEKNRTRYTCREISSGRIYLVPGLATCEISLEK